MSVTVDQQPVVNGRSQLRNDASSASAVTDSVPTSLKELLEYADDFEINELRILRILADQLKSNPRRYLIVQSFKVRENYPLNDWDISFTFKSEQAYSMWKTCSLAALFKLQIDETALSVCPTELSDSYEFKTTVNLENTKNILRFLKPLAMESHFEHITFEDETDDIVEIFCQFLMNSSVHTIQFIPEMHKARIHNRNSKRDEVREFTPWLNFVRNLKPSKIIYYRIKFTQELRKFLGEIADVVENIKISGTSKCYIDIDILPISLDILRRKCNNLYISDEIGLVSFAQIKQMIQYFKTTNRRVSLTVPSYGSLTIGDRIDEYVLKADNTSAKGHMVVIEHISMQPSESCEICRYLQFAY